MSLYIQGRNDIHRHVQKGISVAQLAIADRRLAIPAVSSGLSESDQRSHHHQDELRLLPRIMRHAAVARPVVRKMRVMTYSGPERRFAFTAGHTAAILGNPVKERTGPISGAKLQVSQFVQNKPAGRNTRIVVSVAK